MQGNLRSTQGEVDHGLDGIVIASFRQTGSVVDLRVIGSKWARFDEVVIHMVSSYTFLVVAKPKDVPGGVLHDIGHVLTRIREALANLHALGTHHNLKLLL